MNLSKGEETFAWQCRVLGLEPLREFRFDAKRKFRFDFYFPSARLAVEIEGGTWSNGRHVRGASFAKDIEKYNKAAELGIVTLRYTTDMIMSGEAIDQTVRMIKLRGQTL